MMPTYNQLAASSLLNQQYNAALGLGTVIDLLDTSAVSERLYSSTGVWGWSHMSAVGQSPTFLSLFPQCQDFMASQPEELLWSSRLCRLCHWPLLPRKRERPQPSHRANSLFVQPSALAGVVHRFRRRMYQPVSKPNTGLWCIKPVIFPFLAFVLCSLLILLK